MKLYAFALAICAFALGACATQPVAYQEWFGLDGKPIRAGRQFRQFEAALGLCHGLDRGYGILGAPVDMTSQCMAGQGYFLTGTREAATRPIVP